MSTRFSLVDAGPFLSRLMYFRSARMLTYESILSPSRRRRKSNRPTILTKHSQTPASLFFNLIWPEVSTFIPRSSSKDMRGDLRFDSYVLLASYSACVYECVNRSGYLRSPLISFEEDLGKKVETSGQKQTCWCP